MDEKQEEMNAFIERNFNKAREAIAKLYKEKKEDITDKKFDKYMNNGIIEFLKSCENPVMEYESTKLIFEELNCFLSIAEDFFESMNKIDKSKVDKWVANYNEVIRSMG